MKIIVFVLAIFFLNMRPADALQVNDPAPLFSIREIGGDSFFLSDFVGPKRKASSRGVIISFFASWCKPCKEELPVLDSLADELAARGISIVIIGYKEDAEKISRLLESLGVQRLIVLTDVYGKVGEKYGVRALPMTFIVGSEGGIQAIIRGEVADMRSTVLRQCERLR